MKCNTYGFLFLNSSVAIFSHGVCLCVSARSQLIIVNEPQMIRSISILHLIDFYSAPLPRSMNAEHCSKHTLSLSSRSSAPTLNYIFYSIFFIFPADSMCVAIGNRVTTTSEIRDASSTNQIYLFVFVFT